jgi:hypothetical protein
VGYNPRMRRLLVAACALLLAACTEPADLKTALQVTDVASGWFDAGIVDGKNKLVPSVTFRLRNVSDAELPYVSLNLIFRYADNGEAHEEVFKQRLPIENKQTDVITIRSQTGHVGEAPQSRQEMLQNSYFRDMDAVILVRQSASQWVELHRVRVERQLVTQ